MLQNLEDGRTIRCNNIFNFISIFDFCQKFSSEILKQSTFSFYLENAQLFEFSKSRFTAENEWNFSTRRAKKTNYTVDYSQHFDQLFYMFRLSSEPNLVSDNEYQNLKEKSLQREIIERTTKFYANFIKFG